jgi:hypothetical protein
LRPWSFTLLPYVIQSLGSKPIHRYDLINRLIDGLLFRTARTPIAEFRIFCR